MSLTVADARAINERLREKSYLDDYSVAIVELNDAVEIIDSMTDTSIVPESKV